MARTATMTAIVASSIMMASQASANEQAIYDSCKTALKMNDSECNCIVGKSSGLNKTEMAMFLAMISGDNAGMVAAQGKLSGDEMINVTNFMTRTPTECKGQ